MDRNDRLSLPRVVIVTRKTPWEVLLEQHGTARQAEFYLESRGQSVAEYQDNHSRLKQALTTVQQAIPTDQRRTRVDRADLDRFLFSPDDLVVVVGQDGLVPNAAKYLDGQRVIGINSDPDRYDGVLCSHRPEDFRRLLAWQDPRPDSEYRIERRTMAEAVREDGQRLLALNEVFIGHRSHQSARYRISAGEGKEERHSSSGVICATGTGATGWARSICIQRNFRETDLGPEERRLLWFVREPFPSKYTQTKLDSGSLDARSEISLYSEMGDGGVIFADGMESDAMEFLDGHTVRLRVSPTRLNLVALASRERPNELKGKRRRRRVPTHQTSNSSRTEDLTV